MSERAAIYSLATGDILRVVSVTDTMSLSAQSGIGEGWVYIDHDDPVDDLTHRVVGGVVVPKEG